MSTMMAKRFEKKRRRRSSILVAVQLLLLMMQPCPLCLLVQASSQFEPYQMNGGLVAAVAGRDYVVVAADTRLVLQDMVQGHQSLSSRLWTPLDVMPSTSQQQVLGPDGSILLPSKDQTTENGDDQPSFSSQLISATTATPCLIGSAGCQADCEALKRQVRMQLRAARYFCEGGGGATSTPSVMTTILSQVLYSRRTFPFYAFCVAASLETGVGGGSVAAYDAIGSHETLAVATAGTGRELLQPILDRRFQTRLVPGPAVVDKTQVVVSASESVPVTETSTSSVTTSATAVPTTQVDCSKEEAIRILVNAFRAVSERQVQVGDQVVCCVLQKQDDAAIKLETHCFPLKQH